MTAYTVNCITKPNAFDPHTRIKALGGSQPSNWYKTEDEVIAAIGAGDTFHTLVNGSWAKLEVVRPIDGRRPFLRTDADNSLLDNLLHLPQCNLVR